MYARTAAIAIVIFAGWGSRGALGADRYVVPDGTDAENNCLSVEEPCATIAHAIQQAAPGDIIRLFEGHFTETNILVDRDVAIVGAGEEATFIQGGSEYEWWKEVAELHRVLFVSEGVYASIEGATVRHGCAYGSSGSGIYNEGHLELVDVSVRWNGGYFCDGGGAVFNSGTLLLERVSISENFALFISGENPTAAGIENSGSLEMRDSKINRNHTDFFGDIAGILNHPAGDVEIVASQIDENGTGGPSVGGIYNMGRMTIERSSVSTNYSRDGGPVIISNRGDMWVRQTIIKNNIGYFTAVHNGGTMHLENTTISGNESDGQMSGLVNSGVLYSTANTITNNSAWADFGASGSSGISNTGEMHLASTLVAGNHNELGINDCAAGSQPDFNNAPILSYGYNLIGDASECTLIEVENAGTDILGVDPMLEELADNGGHGETHALDSESPAIDAIPVGVNGCGDELAEDQRGFARPSGAACDIGAFELQIEAHDMIEQLIAFIESLDIPQELRAMLTSDLRDALAFLQQANYDSARAYFDAFIAHTQQYRGGALSTEESDKLIDEATLILAALDAESVGTEREPHLATVEPSSFRLDSNYPNPFNPTTRIPFHVPADSHVKLVVYDVMGREIMRLADSHFPAGDHEVAMDGAGLPSGAYVYRLESGKYVATRQMTLLK